VSNRSTSAYSVIIPAFNASETLAEAIDSLRQQSNPPVSIIVVDDGSTDNTAEVARSFGKSVTLIRQHNQGVGAATNTGMKQVGTPLMAFLDSDDIWLNHKAALQLEIFAARPELSGLCSRAQTFKGSLASPIQGGVFDLWSRTTLMVRTEAAQTVGDMIDPPGGRGDTVDWFARAKDLGFLFELLPEVLAWRRIRPGSLSYGRDLEKDKGYLLVAKRALERKRALASNLDNE